MPSKYTLAFAQELAASRGGRCLSPECNGIKTRLEWECAEGHVWSARLDSVVHNKTWCRKCAAAAKGKKQRNNNLAAARVIAAERGGKCLETKNFPVRGYKPLWECAEGHRWRAIFHNIRRCEGAWCPMCINKSALTLDVAMMHATNRGGKCLSTEYRTKDELLRWECALGHQWSASLGNIRHRGSWCPDCPNVNERLCGEVLHELTPPGYRFAKTRQEPWLKVGKRGYLLELDFYCEELCIAVEYNGAQHYRFVPHFHKSQQSFRDQQRRDKAKAKACERHSVSLIVVPHTTTDGRADFSIRKRNIRRFLVAALREVGYIDFRNDVIE